MKATLLAPIFAILIMSADEARACGRRCGWRGHSRTAVVQSYIQPTASYAPQPAAFVEAAAAAPAVYAPQPATFVAAAAPASPAAYPAATGPQQPPGGGAQPLYTYEASPERGVAYYYTYDESGNLVIKQWMDWLFRGGRRAGLPAPPLPIIGRINN